MQPNAKLNLFTRARPPNTTTPNLKLAQNALFDAAAASDRDQTKAKTCLLPTALRTSSPPVASVCATHGKLPSANQGEKELTYPTPYLFLLVRPSPVPGP